VPIACEKQGVHVPVPESPVQPKRRGPKGVGTFRIQSQGVECSDVLTICYSQTTRALYLTVCCQSQPTQCGDVVICQ
jgi:hypothetical protein